MTLAARMNAGEVLAVPALISHARRGELRHSFRTQADHVLLAPERFRPPRLMGHNRFNLTSFHESDHGGPRSAGTCAAWAWERFAEVGLARRSNLVLAILTQPRFLGYWFNPVSFWMAIEGNSLIGVIAEVNNTFGQRHSYLLTRPDFAPIQPDTRLKVLKSFHVSPFQDVAGEYEFRFALSPDHIAISVRQIDGEGGVDTAMSGPLSRLSAASIILATLRRPGGSLRVIAQIYWHALRLKLKGAAYRPLPASPSKDISE